MASHRGTSVIIVDDHPAILAGVSAWCAAADPPISVLGRGPDAGAAWHDPGRAADVVVLDLYLTGPGPGYGDLRRLADSGRPVVVYTMREDQDIALTCLELGAATYLTKAEGEAHLIEAIRAAARHVPYVPPILAGAMGTDSRSGRPRLTPREVDVLLEWFQCESKDTVSKVLNLSVNTINCYLDRVRIKYANAGRPARTKATLVARAIQDGLVSLDEL
ncbi:response regulator transcription factor [Allokutzneria sp. A3M-2-11 16]|uniref:response regulator transcription factor n=1 Tax=Allokutzneria sp. A3M-2-11 16 TaxID=2962043 RepID=UPI0020B6465E|nr:response regulator transcription factor [Allokutzneria sp. A3M-2-11 16]MCP3804992.1 response regulator transcription factor [Allokutzneria sp. A3M-2-11 16]